MYCFDLLGAGAGALAMVGLLFVVRPVTALKLVGATMVSLLLNMSALYVPFLQRVLKTQPLTGTELLIVFLCASIPFWVMETVKRFNRKYAWYTLE